MQLLVRGKRKMNSATNQFSHRIWRSFQIYRIDPPSREAGSRRVNVLWEKAQTEKRRVNEAGSITVGKARNTEREIKEAKLGSKTRKTREALYLSTEEKQ